MRIRFAKFSAVPSDSHLAHIMLPDDPTEAKVESYKITWAKRWSIGEESHRKEETGTRTVRRVTPSERGESILCGCIW